MSHLFDKDDFWKKINDDVNQSAYRSMGMRLIVDAVEGDSVRLKDMRNEPMGLAPYVGFGSVAPGDSVWVEPVARMVHGSITRLLSWVVIGKIQSAGNAVKLAGSSLTLVGGMDLAGSPNADGSSPLWTIDGATGNAVFQDVTIDDLTVGSINAVFPIADSQTSSDGGASSDLTNYVNAMTLPVSLPVGTWTIVASVGLGGLHSAGTRGQIRCEIDGTGGGPNSPPLPVTAPGYRFIQADHTQSNIAGNRSVNVRVQYRPLDAGTMTPNNPGVWGFARRTD